MSEEDEDARLTREIVDFYSQQHPVVQGLIWLMLKAGETNDPKVEAFIKLQFQEATREFGVDFRSRRS